MSDYLPLAKQLQILFEMIMDESGQPYTLKAVSQATGVSLPTLSQLKNGKITNPQLNTLRAICGFFDIPLRYFDTHTVDECRGIIELRQHNNDDSAVSENPETDLFARMAATLSPQGQQDLLTVLRWARAAEKQIEQGEDPLPVPRLKRLGHE